ncbi:MAG TPA: FMN-binding protein [Planctomycetota bacterium]|nr:FMN-binding protein [Planctomycetota bacterium]
MSTPILLLVCLCVMSSAFGAAAPAASTARPVRSRAEVESLINKEGTSAPPWWNSVKVDPPKTLDLTWAKPAPKEPWTPSKYLGQHIWSVVNENPGRWKYGAKLLHQTLEINKADPDKLTQSMRALASLYHNLLEDYARSAFWYRKAGANGEDNVNLADCYWKLGCKEMAAELLKKIGADDTRHGAVIKLWADMGEFDMALKLADAKAKDGMADIAWLMAGDACRFAGRSKEALDYYARVLKVADADGGRDIKQSRERAKASIDAVKVFDLLDLKKIADGTYSSSSYGYSGQVNVSVVVKASRIQAVNIGAHQEKQYYGSITDTPRQIIARQHVKGVDTFSSATITSEAIINAAAKALSSGMK